MKASQKGIKLEKGSLTWEQGRAIAWPSLSTNTSWRLDTLSNIDTTNLGVAAVADAGRATAAAVPGGEYYGARVHMYQGGSAGMAAHQDSAAGSEHHFLFHVGVLMPACAIKLA